jgi:hypothetical protein
VDRLQGAFLGLCLAELADAGVLRTVMPPWAVNFTASIR